MCKLKTIMILLAAGLLVLSMTGCYKESVQIKTDKGGRPVWPKPPETPRIQFIRSVSNPLDVGIKKSFIGKFIDYMAGRTFHSIVKPYGVETDDAGNLYVVDTFLKQVHVFNIKQKEYYAFPGGKTDFSSPIDLAIENEKARIFVSDSQQGVVKVFTRNGKKFKQEIGRGVFKRPTGIAVNETTRELLVVDTLTANIFRYSLDTLTLKGIFGQNGEKKGRLHYPTHIFAQKDGSIIISDSLNFRVQVFSGDGRFLRTFGRVGDTQGSFSRPKGVAADSQGNVYVVDNLFDNIQIFDSQNRLLMAFGSHGSNPGEFWLPTGIFIDKNDRIYVADSYNKRIQIFQFLKNKNLIGEDE